MCATDDRRLPSKIPRRRASGRAHRPLGETCERGGYIQRGGQEWEIFVCTAGCALHKHFRLLSFVVMRYSTPMIRFIRLPHSPTCRAVVRVLAWVSRERRLSHSGPCEDGVDSRTRRGEAFVRETTQTLLSSEEGTIQLPSMDGKTFPCGMSAEDASCRVDKGGGGDDVELFTW